MSVKLSMSKLGLAQACSYGFRSDVPAQAREPGRAAQLGSLVHALVEAKINGTSECEDVDPALLAEAKEIFEGPLVKFLEMHDWTVCERGYRYDAENDVSADGPRRGEDGYDDVPAMVLPGTVDLVLIREGEAYVVDVKTGKPPADSEQLYAQAVAISRRFGVSRVRVAYARALKTKLDILNDETLDVDALDEKAGRIRRVLRRLPIAEPNRGEWCWRCDARPICPRWRDDDYYPEPEPPSSRLYSDDVRLFGAA